MNSAPQIAATRVAIAPHASTRDAWDRIAPGYDSTNTPTQMALAGAGLRRADVRPGIRFLDVAAGSGALTIPAARLGAQVTAVDQSPAMLELLRQRAQAEGLAVDTRVMDGEHLELQDASFDVVGSQFGVMLFPDMPQGVREMARVVAPQGRVLLTAYADPHRIDFLSFFVHAVQSVRPHFTGPPLEPIPLPFQLQDPRRVRDVLLESGLADVTVETVIESTEFRTGEELWRWIVWSNPIVESVLNELDLSSSELATIEQSMEPLVRGRAGEKSNAVLTNPVNIGVGVKN